MNYTCECLALSFTGRHCEIKAKKAAIREAVSRSFLFVVLIALSIFAASIVVMDVLKYGFGIDPVQEEDDRRRRLMRQQKKRAIPVPVRYLYVNAPSGKNH